MKINVKGTIIPNDDQWIYDLFDIDATSPAKVSKGITAVSYTHLTLPTIA